MNNIAKSAEQQSAIRNKIVEELAAKPWQPEPIDLVSIPRNPMPDLLRDLLEVSQRQTEQTGDLVQLFSRTADEAAVRESKMYRITVISVAVAVVFGIMTVIVALGV